MTSSLSNIKPAALFPLSAHTATSTSNISKSRIKAILSNVLNLASCPHLYQVIGEELIQVAPTISAETLYESRQKSFFLSNQVAAINSFSLKTLQSKRNRIVDLFFHTLVHCDYDRRAITPGSPLECILDNVVYLAHEEPDLLDPLTGRRIHETVSEALFACRLGVKPEKAESAFHSVYYLLSRSQERLGVFKPAIQIAPLEDRYGASEDREAHLAEVVNFSVDKFLGTRLVPYTQLLMCDLFPTEESAPVIGSFQFYVTEAPYLYSKLEGDDLFDANHDALAMRIDTPANQELALHNFEGFAFFDLFTGNNDHHFKNILLKKVSKKMWDLVAIDNANSFPWCHNLDLPSYKMRPLHWFKWSTLPHAQKPFSEFFVDRINALEIDRIEGILRVELVREDVPSSIEHIDGKIKTLRDRYNIIRELANQKAFLSTIAQGVMALTA